MTWRIPTSAVLASALALTTAAAAQNRPVRSDQQILIQLEQDWDAAFRAKDIAFLENILADEFVATYGDGSLGEQGQRDSSWRKSSTSRSTRPPRTSSR